MKQKECIDDLVHKIFNLVKRNAKSYGVNYDYVSIRLKERSPSYSLKIRISRRHKPIENQRFLHYLETSIMDRSPCVSKVTYHMKRYKKYVKF